MSLLFNVSQLLKGTVGERRSYDFSADEPMDLDGTCARAISGQVKFTLTNFSIIASGDAHAVLELTCARCLETFSTPTDIEFEEEFYPIIDIATGLPADGPRTESDFRISANHTIDLSDVIRQDLLLAVELIPLCSKDCKGLCPSCGVNRNVEACKCPPAEVPSPFAVLEELLSDASDH